MKRVLAVVFSEGGVTQYRILCSCAHTVYECFNVDTRDGIFTPRAESCWGSFWPQQPLIPQIHVRHASRAFGRVFFETNDQGMSLLIEYKLILLIVLLIFLEQNEKL